MLFDSISILTMEFLTESQILEVKKKEKKIRTSCTMHGSEST
jgi:hypothetical protein